MRLPNGLNPRQQAFVLAYLTCLNATQAAIEAGYSPKTAQEQGSQLLSNLMVRGVVQGVQEKALERAEATVQRIIAEYVAIAFVNPAKAFEEGQFKPIEQWPEAMQRCIQSYDVEEVWGTTDDGVRTQIGTLKKIRFITKTIALEALGKHLKMWVDGNTTINQTVIIDQVNALVDDQASTRALEARLSRLVGRQVTIEDAVAALHNRVQIDDAAL